MSEIYIRVGDKWGGPLIPFPQQLCDGDRITDQGLRLYMYLVSLMDAESHEVELDPDEIANRLGVHPISMFRTINHLQAEGMLRIRRDNGKIVFFPICDFAELDVLDKDDRYE